VGEVNTT